MPVLENILAGTFGTLEIVALIAFAVFLIGAFKLTKDRKTGKMFKNLGLIVVLIVLVVPYLSPDLFSGIQTQSTAPTTSGGVLQNCAVEDTTVTLSALDAFTASSAGTSHRYKVNGGPALTVSNAGTFTASPGDSLQILWGNETDATYYAESDNVQVACKGTQTFSTDLYANGTLTVRVFNEEGNLIDTAGENETLTTGDVVNLPIEAQGTYQKGFPHGLIAVVEYNRTSIDDAVLQLGGSQTSVPTIYSITYGTESSTKAYEVPPIISNQKLTGTLVLDADDSNEPTALGSDVIITFYPKDYFVNEDNGGSYDGPAVEDEDDVQTFAHTTAFTVQVD